MYAKSPRIVQSANSLLLGVKVYLNESGWFGVLMDFIIIKPLTEQYITLTRTEEGHEKD